MRKLNNSGDTIVEVLICLAIMSAVIGGAYSVASRSLSGIRQAQERAEATKYAETQLERIRYGMYSQVPKQNFPSGGTSFCVTDTLTISTFSNPTNLSGYPANCQRGLYRFEVQFDPAQQNLFTITVRWDGLTGNQQQLQLFYRAFST